MYGKMSRITAELSRKIDAIHNACDIMMTHGLLTELNGIMFILNPICCIIPDKEEYLNIVLSWLTASLPVKNSLPARKELLEASKQFWKKEHEEQYIFKGLD